MVGHNDDEAEELVDQGHLHDLQLMSPIVVVVLEACLVYHPDNQSLVQS